jgi:L-threonylcarbamoyladenylate synthase
VIIPDSPQAREDAAKIIDGGGVIAFRTDTFYGLGVDPFNAAAVARIRELKGREGSKPILLLVADLSDVPQFVVGGSRLFMALAAKFWPGPLTIVGSASDQLLDALTAGSGTIGVRLPDDDGVRALVRRCGGALTATSANVSGKPPARSAKDVADYFGESIELILDGGETTVTEPSTVVDVSGQEPIVIRSGLIGRQQIQSALADLKRSD